MMTISLTISDAQKAILKALGFIERRHSNKSELEGLQKIIQIITSSNDFTEQIWIQIYLDE